MSYPAFTAFKLRALEGASSTTTSANLTANVVPFRCKYLYSIANLQGIASQTGAGALNLAVNSSTTTADSYVTNPFISVTTSTGAVSGGFSSLNNNTTVLYLNQGDTLTTFGSTMVPYTIVHIVQEF